MRRSVAVSSFALLALVFAACSASSQAARVPAAAAGALGIDCPCCFTIVECMRNGMGVECDEVQTVRCERCCQQLTFTRGEGGMLYVATESAPAAMPAQACMPMPPR